MWLAAAAKGLHQMGIGCAVLTETKLTDDRYPKFISGYQVILSKAASPHQGGVVLMWRELEDQGFLVEAMHIVSPNVLTFQLITGDERFLIIGAYISPSDTMGVDDLCAAWAKCPQNCKLLLLGELNFDFWAPRIEQEEIIVDFIDEINFVNLSHKYVQ
jgi:hypothetical protein